MRAALEFCLTEPGQAQHALTISDDVWLYFHGGHVSEGRRWYERSLALATEPTPARAAALWANGLMAINQTDFPAARRLLGESRALAEALGDRSNHATAEAWSGWLAMNEGDLPEATAHLERARAEHLALHDTTAAALDQQFMAKVVLESGDAARAVPLFEHSRDASRAQGNLWLWSWALIQLGRAVWQLGDRQRARKLIVEGLRLKVQLDDRLATGYSLELLAWVIATDDPERAARLLGRARGVLQAVGATGLPYLRADHQECTAHLRATLGEHALTKLIDRGAALTFDEAVAEALQDEAARSTGAEGPAGTEAAAASAIVPPERSPLTRRERQVAALIADGLTNKQIAARLVISRRTAEGHVDHIMTKLGFTSRTQIAAMVTRRPHVA
ncbi:LuxR C-terminal-related transcriptional regulator [Dactylosporangium darangshiense]|uniref:HTH luxR-type domain-containing protein n=1 Tax=Dactylosporangium darangshiense TaxID=579108 RepID=A0ABP8DPB8_9ACTN